MTEWINWYSMESTGAVVVFQPLARGEELLLLVNQN